MKSSELSLYWTAISRGADPPTDAVLERHPGVRQYLRRELRRRGDLEDARVRVAAEHGDRGLHPHREQPAAPGEAHRQADSVSRLDVVATDLCDTSHPIDQVAVALGPAPGVSVSELAITEEHAPDWECSVPIAGGVTPLIRVTASPASVGASVTVWASSGSFAGGFAEQTLTLIDAGDRAQATTFFLPGAAGTAVITAAGKGATATPLAVRVVDGPSITAPATALQRGLAYGVTVSTAGNLEACLVEEVVPGAAIVTAIEPALGIISGQTSVRADPVSCDSEERLRLTVQFVDDAPDEAAVTLRCFDTYGQAAQATFAVAPAAPEILIDGDLQ